MRDPFFLAKLRAFILGLRPRKIRRRLLERRARRLAQRQRRALEVSTPSVFVLEPLEGRVLLSADFTGAVDLVNQPILRSEAPVVSVLLDTHAPQSASGPGLVSTVHSHHDGDDRGPHAGFIGPAWSDWHLGEKHGSPDPRGHQAQLSLEAHLKHDTGASASDGVTSDPTIAGTLGHSARIKSFKAGLDDTPTRDFVSIKDELGPEGRFVLDRADLARINTDSCHAALADGTHTLHLIATDVKGHMVERDITFVLDTRPPRRPTLDLAPAFDSAPVGDHRSTFDVVTLVGRTSPGAFVALIGTEAATTADPNGRFAFDDVALDVGANFFKVQATDLAGNKSFGSVCITHIQAAVPTLSIDDVAVTEGNAGTTNAVFTVTLSAASTQPITVGFATADNTATAPGDYAAQAGTLTFAPGTTTQHVTVGVAGDTTFEADETFLVTLANPVNATVADGDAVGTIVNDDAPPSLSISDVTVTEGNAGTTSAVFAVTLTGATALPTIVSFTTADGTATAGSDYTASSGTLGFAPGTTAQEITVAVLGDTVAEPTETFTVDLSAPLNATIADPEGIGAILDDDTVAAPTVSIGDVTVTEGNAGTTSAVFTVSLSTPASQIVTVGFAAADDTATAAGHDYTPTAGTLTFAPGTTTQQLTVPVVGDTIFEHDETFLVSLSGATSATIQDAQGVGTITNDDASPALAVNDVTVTEGDSGATNAVFTVSL